MKILHNIGKTLVPHARGNYNSREEVERTTEALSFDGIYTNVWENRDLIKGRKCLLFVVGNTIGKDNSFDVGMPRETFCTESQLKDLTTDGHILAWHTWSHPDLTLLSYEEAKKEMTSPFSCEDFAYPYGRFNEMLIEIAKELGYKRAWSTTQGNSNPYSLKRTYL